MKIGLFDSGVGGISVLRKLISFFPYNDYLYFGDVEHTPYGTKSDREISFFVGNILNFLESKGVDIIVAACNTADSVVRRYLRKKTATPYVSIIDNVRRLIRTDRVGVVSTKSTIKSGVYEEVLDGKIVYKKHLQPLVMIIENASHERNQIKKMIEEDLKDIYEYGVKELILGCTHFSLVYDIFEEVLLDIKIIDPADGVVDFIGEKFGDLRSNGRRKAKVEFYTSGDPKKFKQKMENFMNLRNADFLVEEKRFGGVECETNIHNFGAVGCGEK